MHAADKYERWLLFYFSVGRLFQSGALKFARLKILFRTLAELSKTGMFWGNAKEQC